MDVAARLGSWAEGPGPLHRKLADALQSAVERGDLPTGSRLPPERALARSLAVSRSTVVAAYDRLRADGLIESRQGSGTRVRWSAGEGRLSGWTEGSSGEVIFRRLIEGPGTFISLSAALCPSAPEVAEAAASFSAAELTDLIGLSGYVPLGFGPLRQAIAAYHTGAGLPTTASQVLVTTGAQQAISLAAGLLVHPGDVVLVENPSFSGTLDALRAAGARLVAVPMDDEGADVGAVARLADQTSPAAVYLMPSYHNPTGLMLSEARRRRLARISAERGLPVIEDNALEPARLDPEPPPPAVAAFDPAAPVLTIGSLSKVLWAGLRVGWVRASEDMINRLVQHKVVHDLGSPVFTQAIAARMLPHLEEVRERRRHVRVEHLGRAEALLAEHVPDWAWGRPAGGLALWVRLPSGDGGQFCQVALRHGVEVVPGATMSPDGSFADHLRLALVEPPLLDEGIARLGRAWQAYEPAASRQSHLRVIV